MCLNSLRAAASWAKPATATIDIAPAKVLTRGSHSSEEDDGYENPDCTFLIPQAEVFAAAVVAEPVDP